MQSNGGSYARKSQGRGEEKLTRGILLMQDNAPAQTSHVAVTAMTECGFEIFPHPPYSRDIAPYDFYLFPKLKFHLRGTQYGSNEGIIGAVNEYLGEQEKVFYYEGIIKIERRWDKCIALKGDYIEK